MKAMHLVALALACACAPSSKATGVRFANQPAVTRVADRENVPHIPVERVVYDWFYLFDGSLYQNVVRGLDIPRHQRALGINALDEVPNSTWFTNRNAVHRLTPAQVATGPAVSGNPEKFTPWTIVSTKTGGTSPGFLIRDSRGLEFIVKFDRMGDPIAVSAAGVIGNRLMWAAGFNVPEDYVVDINMRDLVVTNESRAKDAISDEPLTRTSFDRIAKQLQVGEDGHLRGQASLIIGGRLLGPQPGIGVRTGDPNDVIPHERRRDLRALYALFAWLDNVDVKETNTLDTFVSDPKDPSRRYVMHYQIDFDSSLGTVASYKFDLRRGYEYNFDPSATVTSFFSAGLEPRRWEDRSRPAMTGVGMYEAHGFVPGKWRPNTPAYTPFLDADRFDNYWGAKLVMSFTPAQIHAAVSAGRLRNPVAEEYLVQQIIARQRMTGAYWFSQVNPLERFTVRAYGNAVGLCFDDLMLTNHLVESSADTRYAMVTADRLDREVGRPFSIHARPDGKSCTGPLTTATDGDGYTIVKLTTRGRGEPLSTHVHIARDPATRQFRVIGIDRR